jgi:hypothetical protein
MDRIKIRSDQIWFLGSDNLFASLSGWPPITYHLMILVMVTKPPLTTLDPRPFGTPRPSRREVGVGWGAWDSPTSRPPLSADYDTVHAKSRMRRRRGSEIPRMFFHVFRVPGQFDLRFLSVFFGPAARSRTILSVLALAFA